MRELEKKLADLKERIEKEIFHPYLRQYLISPIIDEDKILIIISAIDQLEYSPQEKETIVIAIMLMEIALHIHDHVSNQIHDDSSMKITQLTVLAGDYYSGLYYKFLAGLDDIGMIKMLSMGVKIINEHKVIVYHQEPKDIDSLMNSIKLVEFSLIGKLTEYLRVDGWDELFANFLLQRRLFQEIQQFNKDGKSILFDALESIVFGNKTERKTIERKKQLILVCERYIEQIEFSMESLMNRVPRLNNLIEQRMFEDFERHSKAITFAEEG